MLYSPTMRLKQKIRWVGALAAGCFDEWFVA